MDSSPQPRKRSFFPTEQQRTLKALSKEALLEDLKKMVLIRQFEVRAEASYLQGKIGGFFHSYIGQEAIQTALLRVLGVNHWFITTYRCHALALLLGATPNELMAELFGKVTGNAKGRGGSMHFYTERLLGGFGIVGGQIPIATGAAFSLKYKDKKEEIAVCFLGDGAVAQGAFHESLNLASLWSLPCLYVIENNQWGMGTAVEKAVAADRLAEDFGPAYKIQSYTFDGMDYLHCYEGFTQAFKEVLTTGRPVLVEAVTDRFRGHSISDPGLYRTKESLKESMGRDPLQILKEELIKNKILDEETYRQLEKEQREVVIAAIEYADDSPWPEPATIGEDVFAP